MSSTYRPPFPLHPFLGITVILSDRISRRTDLRIGDLDRMVKYCPSIMTHEVCRASEAHLRGSTLKTLAVSGLFRACRLWPEAPEATEYFVTCPGRRSVRSSRAYLEAGLSPLLHVALCKQLRCPDKTSTQHGSWRALLFLYQVSNTQEDTVTLLIQRCNGFIGWMPT